MIAIAETATSSSATHVSDFLPFATQAGSRIRVWLTDDNAGIRDSLAQVLDRAEGFDCEQQFHSAESLLQGLARGPAPEVILLDIEMGGMSGVDALRPIRALAPDVRVLMVTTFFDPKYALRAAHDGASAYVLKASAPETLAAEIHRALATPIHMAELLPTAAPTEQAHDAAAWLETKPHLTMGKGFGGRLAAWFAQVGTALSSHMHFHRPAATSE